MFTPPSDGVYSCPPSGVLIKYSDCLQGCVRTLDLSTDWRPFCKPGRQAFGAFSQILYVDWEAWI